MIPTSARRWKAVRAIGRDMIQLLYPHLCAGCGSNQLSDAQHICIDCLQDLPYTHFEMHERNPVQSIFEGRIRTECAASLFYFTKGSPVQRMLHRLKYQDDRNLGIALGQLMGEAFQNTSFAKADALIPLPLYFSREKKRGYNQSTLLCKGISGVTGIPLLDKAVIRKRITETQTHKTRIERWQNIEGKFSVADAGALAGKFVILVDDVLTTGATLEACGAEILKTKNLKLGIATFAYTSP